MSKVKYKKSPGERVSELIINILLVIIVFVMIYPFWHVLMYSLSDSRAAMSGGLFFYPRKFTLITYRMLIRTKQIFIAFKNSVLKTVLATFFSLIITALTAYPLSIPGLKGRRLVQVYIFFTMLFSGGIIPTYLLIKDLHMLDTFWVYLIPGMLSAHHMFILRNFFQAIPDSLEESAMLDGASHMDILLWIVLPLSKAAFATQTMFYGVSNWNEYMDGVLYVNDQRLQVYLRQLIYTDGSKSVLSGADLAASAAVTEESMKMTVVAITVLPVIIVYSFLQKYYMKGIMIGSVKE